MPFCIHSKTGKTVTEIQIFKWPLTAFILIWSLTHVNLNTLLPNQFNPLETLLYLVCTRCEEDDTELLVDLVKHYGKAYAVFLILKISTKNGILMEGMLYFGF